MFYLPGLDCFELMGNVVVDDSGNDKVFRDVLVDFLKGRQELLIVFP